MFASRSLNHYLFRVDDYHFMNEEEDEATKDSRNKKYEQEYDDDSYKIVKNVVQETEQELDKYLDKVNAKALQLYMDRILLSFAF